MSDITPQHSAGGSSDQATVSPAMPAATGLNTSGLSNDSGGSAQGSATYSVAGSGSNSNRTAAAPFSGLPPAPWRVRAIAAGSLPPDASPYFGRRVVGSDGSGPPAEQSQAVVPFAAASKAPGALPQSGPAGQRRPSLPSPFGLGQGLVPPSAPPALGSGQDFQSSNGGGSTANVTLSSGLPLPFSVPRQLGPNPVEGENERRLSDVRAHANWAIGTANAKAASYAAEAQQTRFIAHMALEQSQATVDDQARQLHAASEAVQTATYAVETRVAEVQSQAERQILETQQYLVAEAGRALQHEQQTASLRLDEVMRHAAAEHERRIAEVMARVDQLQQLLLESQTEVANMSNRLEAALADNHRLVSGLAAVTAERDAVYAQRLQLEERLSSAQRGEAEANDRHTQQEARVLLLEQRLAGVSNASEAYAQLSNELDTRLEEIDRLRRELVGRDTRIAALEVQCRAALPTGSTGDGPAQFRLTSNSPEPASATSITSHYNALQGSGSTANFGATSALPSSSPSIGGLLARPVPPGPVGAQSVVSAAPPSGSQTPASGIGGYSQAMTVVHPFALNQSQVSGALPQAPPSAPPRNAQPDPARDHDPHRSASERGRSPPREATPPPGSTLKESLGDKLNIGNIPTSSAQVRKWKEMVRNGVASCAVSCDLAWQWVKVVETHGLTLLDFAQSHWHAADRENRELNRLDYKLKQQISVLNKSGPLDRYLTRAENEYQSQYTTPLKGRQLLWLIYQYYSVGEATDKIHKFNDLLAVQWKGDDNIVGFLDKWFEVFTQLDPVPDAAILREVLLSQVRRSTKEMKHDLEEWDRMAETDPNKCYTWLMSALDRRVALQRRLRNVADMTASVSDNRQSKTQPAVPGPQTGSSKPPNVCFTWQKTGSCPNGQKCPYAHSPDQKGIKAPQNPRPPSQQRAPSSGPTARRPCYNFADGKCTRTNCPFEHRQLTKAEKKEKEEAAAKRGGSAGRTPSPPNKPQVCVPFSKSGSCAFGLACRMIHPGMEAAQRAARDESKAKAQAKAKGKSSN